MPHEFVVIKDPNNLEFCFVITREQDEDNRWRDITSIVVFYFIISFIHFINISIVLFLLPCTLFRSFIHSDFYTVTLINGFNFSF
jgi:hypothetical protein